MGSIPPNGAVANTTRVFDGAGRLLKEKTVNIPCDSVNEAREIGDACVQAVQEVAKRYGKEVSIEPD